MCVHLSTLLRSVFPVVVLATLVGPVAGFNEPLMSLSENNDYRVEALGGAGILSPGEKNELNLFNLRNPSGMVLLPAKNRLDYSLASRFYQSAMQDSELQLGGTGGGFQGVLYRILPKWALQVATSANGLLNTYGNPAYDSGQLPHVEVVGSMGTAYELSPGLALGAEYQYARPIREVYEDNDRKESSFWQVGAGYQHPSGDWTVGINGGAIRTSCETRNTYTNHVLNQRTAIHHAPSGIGYLQPYGPEVTVLETYDWFKETRAALDENAKYNFVDSQMIYRPNDRWTFGCLANFLQKRRIVQDIQETNETTSYTDGTVDDHEDFVETRRSVETVRTEEDLVGYTLQPILLWQCVATSTTEMHVGFSYKHYFVITEQTTAHSTRDRTYRRTPPDIPSGGVMTTYASFINPYTTTRRYDYISDEFVTDGIVLALSAQSVERQWWAGLGLLARAFVPYSVDDANEGIGVGFEYWFLSKLATRVGCTYMYLPRVTAGIGWEEAGYNLDVFYRATIYSGQAQNQMVAVGCTVPL